MIVTVTTVITFAQLLANIFFCIYKIKITVSFMGFDWRLLKEIAIFSSFLFINILIDQRNWNVE